MGAGVRVGIRAHATHTLAPAVRSGQTGSRKRKNGNAGSIGSDLFGTGTGQDYFFDFVTGPGQEFFFAGAGQD